MFLLISPAAPDRTCRMSRQERDLTEPGGRARTARECPSEGQEQGKGTQSSLELLASRRSGSQTTAEPRAEAVQARALAGRGGAGRGHYISRRRSTRTATHSLQNALPWSRLLSWRCRGRFPRSIREGRSDWPARPCSGWPERVEAPDWSRRTCNASSRGGRGGLPRERLWTEGPPTARGGSGCACGRHLY